MKKEILLISILCFSVLILNAQNRTANGTNNNPMHFDWGSAGSSIDRMMPAAYGDQISSPNGVNRPNPRTLSNVIFDQGVDMPNIMTLSDFWWQWGQFVDHDITEMPGDASEFFPISVPLGDPYFDPFATGNEIIPQSRGAEHAGTGTSTANPRLHTNNITSWLDGSGIYGSDENRMNYLRSFVDGKLRMSANNYLPFNTVTGEYADDVDPLAPSMANENPFISKYYVAGDVRANEQTALLSMHTLFAREHNRLCEEFKLANPSMSDEDIFQKARKFVGGFIQNITYYEWLPSSGLNLMPYSGFDIMANPALTAEFSGSAFRLGHTMIPDKLIRLENNGDTISEGPLALKFAFFNPLILNNEGGIEPVFKGMATHMQQTMDAKVVGDLRNFLFGPPGSGGLDLVALNINRGRDLGLPDFNSIRSFLGLSPLTDFSQLTSDVDLAAILTSHYGDINDLDAWVGMLAEDHLPGKAFGEVTYQILLDQFSKLRNGDWYYFENDNALSAADKLMIKNTNLADIIRRNSSIENLQNEVFYAQSHQVCEVDPIYGCVGCYTEGQPKPKNLGTQTYTNSYKLKWAPIPNTIACQVNGGAVGGTQVFLTVYGSAPSQKWVNFSALEPGTVYQWRVRCGCQISPSIIAGDWSDYSYFLHSGPITEELSEMEQIEQEMYKVISDDVSMVYPNPFSETTTISFNRDLNGSKKTVKVFDAVGKLVSMEFSIDDEIQFQRDGLSSGIYFYSVFGSNNELIDQGKLSID